MLPKANKITSSSNPLSSYTWGENCSAHVLADNGSFSVKQETMLAGSEEILHYHQHVTQYFYILKGNVSIEINTILYELKSGDSIEIQPMQPHKIFNISSEKAEFIVYSQPSINKDRINL